MKQIIRLTESDLHKIVSESVKSILLKEIGDTPKGQMALGALAAKKMWNKDYSAHDDVSKYARNARENGDYKSLRDAYFDNYSDYIKSRPKPKQIDPQLYEQAKNVFINGLAEQKPTFTRGGYMRFECDGYEFEIEDIDYDVDIESYAYDEPPSRYSPGGFIDAEGDVYPCMSNSDSDLYMSVRINGGEWMDMLMDMDMKSAVDEYCEMNPEDMQEVLNEVEYEW